MTAVSNKFHEFKNKIEVFLENLSRLHPIVSFVTMLICTPLFILGLVAIFTIVFALPMCYFCGWM